MLTELTELYNIPSASAEAVYDCAVLGQRGRVLSNDFGRNAPPTYIKLRYYLLSWSIKIPSSYLE